MKIFKFISVFLLLLSLATPTQAENSSESVTVKHLVKGERMLLIERPNEENPWLINYQDRCSFVEGGKTTLSLYNDLDGYEDKIGGREKCKIIRSEPINMELKVNAVYPSGTVAYLQDEQGQLYRLGTDNSCSDLKSYKKKLIYGWRYEEEFSEEDDLFLPFHPNVQCNINSLEKIILEDKKNSSKADETGPSQVSEVKVTPGNGQAYLRWKAASDKSGVDYYLISTSPYSLDPEGADLRYMPNQEQTVETHYFVKGLENNEEYFFYVLAVDKRGNPGGKWSKEVSTTPNSAIRNLDSPKTTPVPRAASKKTEFRKVSEDSSWIRFEWNKQNGTLRQTVILKQKGQTQNEWIQHNWPETKLTFAKSTLEKGVIYELNVKNYSQSALLADEKLEFSI